jgi:hypothetical protein
MEYGIEKNRIGDKEYGVVLTGSLSLTCVPFSMFYSAISLSLYSLFSIPLFRYSAIS